MTRRTCESVVLFALIVLVGALTLYRYHRGRPRFRHLMSIPLTGAVHVAQLARSKEHRLNINSASAEALDALPGVSSNIAADIIAYRKEQPFTDIAEISRIDGIGEKRLAVLVDLVYCGKVDEAAAPDGGRATERRSDKERKR